MSVLAYAVGGDHPLREPCRTLVDAIREGRLTASTTPEVIQEFAHVRARRRERADAAALARHFADLLSPLLLVGKAELDRGLRIFEDYPDLGSFDAVLAGVAMREAAEGLVSTDRAFGLVRGLRYVDPATPAFDRLLA
jgi:predicted nucleic acid-binding protein